MKVFAKPAGTQLFACLNFKNSAVWRLNWRANHREREANTKEKQKKPSDWITLVEERWAAAA